jgi:hypothetical protein
VFGNDLDPSYNHVWVGGAWTWTHQKPVQIGLNHVKMATGQQHLVIDNVLVDQTSCRFVTLMNTGCDTLGIRGIIGCTGSPFALDTTMTQHVLPPGGLTTVGVCVTPTSFAVLIKSLTIVSNAVNSPFVMGVTAIPQNWTTGTRSPATADFEITAVVPNPFNPETTIRFTLPEAMPVTGEVYTVTGARVRTLARDAIFPGGENEIAWDGRDDAGRRVASGVYLARLRTTLGTRVARMILLE